MSLRDQLIAALGLDPAATDEDILAAVPKPETAACQAELQSAMTELAATFGVDAAKPTAIVAAAKVAQAQAAAVPSMQARQETALRTASEAYVDGEIARKRAIKPSDRDWFVTLHMEQPDLAKRSIEALPLLGETSARATPPAASDALPSLNAEELGAAKALGKTPDQLAALVAADRKKGTI